MPLYLMGPFARWGNSVQRNLHEIPQMEPCEGTQALYALCPVSVSIPKCWHLCELHHHGVGKARFSFCFFNRCCDWVSGHFS